MLRFVSQISQWFNEPAKRTSTSFRLTDDFSYQNLEQRNLLAGISFDAGTGIVSVLGDARDDISFVRQTSATDIQVILAGFPAQTFTASSVSRVDFFGLDGNDFFRNETNINSEANGGAGNDRLFGGSGNDLFAGGDGDDYLSGGDGIDTLIGNAGNDRLRGGSGGDLLSGNAGDDFLIGDDGDDILLGGDGNDIILAGAGNDDVRGDDGDDLLFGEAGNDFVLGGEGNDFLSGAAGDDNLSGGNGNDVIRGGDGNDRLNGDAGDDRLIAEGGNDFAVFGGLGDDYLNGGSGDDFMDGNEGNDLILGGDGNDTIFGSDGDDRVFAGSGNDTVYGGFGLDLIAGEAGDDLLFGDDQADTIFGNDGNDRIFGGQGNDLIHGGNGNDYIDGGLGSDIAYGNAGNDEIHGGADADQLFGGDGNDRLFGEGGADLLRGLAGNDALVGGVDAADRMIGDDGKDRFLTFGDDVAVDISVVDAELVFRNGSNEWTDAELKVIDDGLDLMQNRTANTRLFKGTLTKEPLVFIKEFTIPQTGRLGANDFVTTTESVFNPVTGLVDQITKSEHQIRFGDWDETDSTLNTLHAVEVTREIAHNWASTAAITAVLSNQASFFLQFRNISGWTQTQPADNVLNFYDSSLDNNWYFLKAGLFTETFATTNPVEDFSATWKFFFDPATTPAERAVHVTKLERLDGLFTRLEIF